MTLDPPRWRSPQRVLLTGGFVYTPADPFATAMLVAGDEVAWVGSEGAALAMADGVDRVVELAGALVTPAFVDAHAVDAPLPALVAERAAAGVGLLHVVEDAAASMPHAPADAEARPLLLAFLAADQLAGTGWDAVLGTVVEVAGSPEELAERVIDARGGGGMVCLQVRQAEQAGVVVEALSTLTRRSGGAPNALGGQPGGVRLDLAVPLTHEQIEQVALAGVPVCVRADAATGLTGMPLATMAAAGVPLAFGGADPWATIAAAVHHPDDDQRISARAAFLAHTRGGWRAAGMPGQGILAPGSAAHYAVWRVDDLVVQAPDDRIQAWSTDPRSGTPGLPDLSPGAARPRLQELAVWGAPVAIGV